MGVGAVIDLGGQLLVCKSDPVTFATDRIGDYLVQVNANDLATTGLYIDPELSDTASLSFISDEQNEELAEVELVTRRVPHNPPD